MAEEFDIIFALTFIFEIGSVIAIALSIYAFVLMQKIKELFPGGKIVKKWLTMQIIMIAFISLQVLGLIFIFAEDENLRYIVTGMFNLSAGIFVLIITNLTYKTYKLILLESKQ